MSAVDQPLEQPLFLRTASRDSWDDPTGIRSVIRHGMSRQGALVLLGAGLTGLVIGTGAAGVFGALVALAAAQLLAAPLLERLRRPVTAEQEFRFSIIAWPVAMFALGAVGWSEMNGVGEIVAVAGFLVAALVALAERPSVAIAWTAISAAATAAGAAGAGELAMETFVAMGAICGGAIVGLRLRTSLEVFLGARRLLMRDVSRVPVDPDPFVTADLLLIPLVRWTPLRNPSLIWFRDDGRAVFLAVAGENLPPALHGGKALPQERNAMLRQQAAHGPWINGWSVKQDDEGYSRGIAGLGINAVAYVPLVYENRVLGVVAAGLSDRADDRSAMAEYIPTLVQFADAAAVELGPILRAADRHSTARQVVRDILERSAFSPVFQPVRRLADGAIVGYEALTRFDVAGTTADIFESARLSDPEHSLEFATLEAAVSASRQLPDGPWLSLNVSAGVLTDSERLRGIVREVRQPVLIELSEHDKVADYRPIAQAMRTLGPNCRLAVDDAGAGFASLRHILEVRPGFVKLDLGLVQGVAEDLTRTALVAGFVRFAADAGFELIAEGIESEGDREALQRLGVEHGQGYLLGKPQCVENLVEGLA